MVQDHRYEVSNLAPRTIDVGIRRTYWLSDGGFLLVDFHLKESNVKAGAETSVLVAVKGSPIWIHSLSASNVTGACVSQ